MCSSIYEQRSRLSVPLKLHQMRMNCQVKNSPFNREGHILRWPLSSSSFVINDSLCNDQTTFKSSDRLSETLEGLSKFLFEPWMFFVCLFFTHFSSAPERFPWKVFLFFIVKPINSDL